MGRLARTANPRQRRSVALFALALASAALLLLPVTAVAWQPGVPLSTPFPRLAMWWPDTDTQSAEQLARYDWLALTDHDRSAIARIRALHADEILLNSTNACELDLDPWGTRTSEENADVAKLPAQWLLTQVGTTLSAAIDASTTSVPVSALTATSAGKTVALFAAGENVVVDDEIMYVAAVNPSGPMLTVRRGFAKRAVSHDAGVRIAATICFWPRSVLVDLTSACPRVTVDSSAGPETWAEYNARIGAALATDADWDGILLDRSDGEESWLVDAGYTRSIDLNRSNQLPNDYSAFDEAWNAGVGGYELRLRALVGSGKLIFANWGYPNFGVLNGNNFEGFPSVSETEYPWQSLVEGPSADSGSYFDWLGKAQQPNLTTIETYQDESMPDAGGDGSSDNPATEPGFVPNYAKMRYGLTTALLGDGFFSYEVGTNGHGSMGLMWFDEYDGAGRGQGYLGQPVAAARRAWDPLPTPDSLTGDGAFDTLAQKGTWTLEVDGSARASAARDTATVHNGTGALRVNVTTADHVDWHASINHPLAVTRGKEYTLSFWARSDSTHTVNSWIQQAHGPDWDDLAYLGTTEVTPEWQRIMLTATASATDAKSWIVLALGDSTGSVWLDDIQVRPGDPNVWRRPYDNGIAVVNSTEVATVVPLGGSYRRLLGTQAANVNDGRLASSVTVGARTGVVLVKPDMGLVDANIDSACAPAASAASYSRSVRNHYAKARKHGSRVSRKRSAKAYAAWKLAASSADALVRDLALARTFTTADDPRLADSVTLAEKDAATLVSRSKRACTAGHASAWAPLAPVVATTARCYVLRAAVSPR